MPLRDHFPRSPRSRSWDRVHGMWSAMMVADLNRRLPERYVAAPRVYLGSTFEIDVATYDQYQDDLPTADATDGGGGVATAILAPPQPTLAVATDMPDLDVYEVLIEDMEDGGRLVAAVEIVSPANKDRPASRRAFVAKCGSMLLDNVCVAAVDLVTIRKANLYGQLLGFLGVTDPSLTDEPPPIYAAACRWLKRRPTGILEAWAHPLEIGRALPTLPLWLDEDHWVSLDLGSSYEETCRNLRLP
jgi:Protein of unknown function (DUF4058)